MKLFPIFLLILSFTASMSTTPNEKLSWIPLFNDKNLNGWTQHGHEKWIAEHGEILGQALTQEYGYLATIKTYKNFELKGKLKTEGRGNSGIFYHSVLDGVDIKGVQFEIDPNSDKNTGGLYESGGRGWLAKPRTAGGNAFKPGQWNDISFSVIGNHVVTFVNGVEAVDFRDPDPRYFNGVIALQLHSGGEGKIRFKEFYIREIN